MEGVSYWNEIKRILCDEFKSPIKQQWINSTSATITNNTAKIIVPNKMVSNFIGNHLILIKRLFEEIMLSKIELEIEVLDEVKESDNPNVVSITNAVNSNPTLNTRYTFENFVVGSNNQFAYTACKAVSEDLNNTKYNPLFLFGASGLGKTHLLHAIGNNVVDKLHNKRVIYIKSEKFVSEYVDSIRSKTIDKFRKKFRKNFDVLLIDDIQFFSGKEQTQEELFYTLSDAKQNNKVVVLASDKLASEIDGFDQRLKTRLLGGLVCDIKAPELETRIAIVKNKAKELDIEIPEEAVLSIAKNFNSSVRELEGSIIRISAFASFSGMEITEDLINEVEIKNIARKNEAVVDVNHIIKVVSNYYDVSFSEILGVNRDKDLVLPRHVAIYLARHITQKSYSDLARIFKKKNHATISHACENIEYKIKLDKVFQDNLNMLEKKCRNL